MKRTCLLIILFAAHFTVFAQDSSKVEWLGRKTNFPVLFMDPTENQCYLAFAGISKNNIFDYDLFIPFGFGFHKSIVRWKRNEIALHTGVNVQFGWRKEDNEFFQGFRRSLFNTDYIVGFNYSLAIKPNLIFNVNAYHRSSHLGDDFVLLNGLTPQNYWNNDPANYEMIRTRVFYNHDFVNVYGSIGAVTRIDTFRGRMEFQAGAYLQDMGQSKALQKLTIGFDLRILQHNNFEPNLNLIIGMKIGDAAMVMLNYYYGHFPYSRYESEINEMYYGAGFYLNSIL